MASTKAYLDYVLEQLSGLCILRSGQSHQDMNGLYLPGAAVPGFLGGKPEYLFGSRRKALGQRQVRRPRAIEQLGHGADHLRLHPQQAEQSANFPGLLQKRQQNMNGAHIAVAQHPGFFTGGADQFVC